MGREQQFARVGASLGSIRARAAIFFDETPTFNPHCGRAYHERLQGYQWAASRFFLGICMLF